MDKRVDIRSARIMGVERVDESGYLGRVINLNRDHQQFRRPDHRDMVNGDGRHSADNEGADRRANKAPVMRAKLVRDTNVADLTARSGTDPKRSTPISLENSFCAAPLFENLLLFRG